jgi:hypothetical protein
VETPAGVVCLVAGFLLTVIGPLAVPIAQWIGMPMG